MNLFKKSESEKVIKALKSNSISKSGRLLELLKSTPLDAWNKEALELLIYRALELENSKVLLIIVKNLPLQIVREVYQDRVFSYISKSTVNISAADLIKMIPPYLMNKKYLVTILKNKTDLNFETALSIIPANLLEDKKILENLIDKSESYITVENAQTIVEKQLPLEIMQKLYRKIDPEDRVFFLNSINERFIPDDFIQAVLVVSYPEEFEQIIALPVSLKIQGLEFLDIISRNKNIQPEEIFSLIPVRLRSDKLIIDLMNCLNSSSDIPVYYSQIPVNSLNSEICFAALKECFNETFTGSNFSEGMPFDTMLSQMDAIIEYTPDDLITDEIQEFYDSYKEEGRSRLNDVEMD